MTDAKTRVWQGRGNCLGIAANVKIVAHPFTLTLSPEAGERGFFWLPLPLGEGGVRVPFHASTLNRATILWCVPSFERVSDARPTAKCPSLNRGCDYATEFKKTCTNCTVS